MLKINNLTHGFGERILYNNVNLTINKGDKIGLIGENGAGKTTLIKILCGQILSDYGDVIWDKKANVGYLDQFAEIDKNQTVYQYLESAFFNLIEIEDEYNSINEQMSKSITNTTDLPKLMKKSGELFEILVDHNYYSIPSEIKKLSAGLGVDSFGMDTKIDKLSGGQRVKLMFTKLLLEKPDLLILDEPTNFLDNNHIDWLTKYLQEYKGSFLIISHDISFLNNVINTIWAIDMQSIHTYPGNYDKYLKIKEELLTQHNKIATNQAEKEKKLKEYIAKNSTRTATAKQAKSRAKLLEKLQNEKLEIIKESLPPEIVFKYTNIDNSHLLVVKNLTIGYNKPLIQGINLKLLNKERYRISGFNGIGKTTFLNTICGKIPQLSGTININNNVVFNYYQQDYNFIDENLTAIDEIYSNYSNLTIKEIRSLLAHTGLSTKRQTQPISTLSGGEKCKIQLCLMMQKSSNLLIFDEPTNHLDYKAKQSLANAINKFPGSVIFVSHEQDFVNLINNYKILDFSKLKKEV